jgi:hypothetical protein
MICVSDVGVANMNGCVGLQEPSALAKKLLQFGPAKAGEASPAEINAKMKRSDFMVSQSSS